GAPPDARPGGARGRRDLCRQTRVPPQSPAGAELRAAGGPGPARQEGGAPEGCRSLHLQPRWRGAGCPGGGGNTLAGHPRHYCRHRLRGGHRDSPHPQGLRPRADLYHRPPPPGRVDLQLAVGPAGGSDGGVLHGAVGGGGNRRRIAGQGQVRGHPHRGDCQRLPGRPAAAGLHPGWGGGRPRPGRAALAGADHPRRRCRPALPAGGNRRPNSPLTSDRFPMSLSKINLLDFSDPKIRTLHLTWVAFFLTFVVWFNHAPLKPLLMAAFAMTNDQWKTLLTLNVALTIPARIVIGMLVDRFGPRHVFSALLMLAGVFCTLFALARDYQQLALLRLLL